MAQRIRGTHSTPRRPLTGAVALVAGATRGAGRGIARALGEAGALVYCTGRSVRGDPSPYQRPETIEETAELIAAAGGRAHAVRVDHGVEEEVRALVDRVARDHGRLDVLVNSVAGEDPVMGAWGPFWAADLARADTALRQGLVSHIITAKHAAALMIRRRRGLLVEVTENDLLISSGSILAQVVRVCHKALAAIWAAELRPHRVTAVAVTPGFLRSERMLEHFGVTEARWREAGRQDPNFLHSESPLFVGRAIAALAADPRAIDRTGQLLSSWELGRHYGIADIDGRRPDWGKANVDFSDLPQPFLSALADALDVQAAWLATLSARTAKYRKSFLAKTRRHRLPDRKKPGGLTPS